ncbi:MAG: hypothetical protein ACD_37C00066G0002 [uncultured bacterium]|nr:MAG: hypothetical protein ACD_37C00066G0002 [uncultured bacterium]
MLSPVIIDSSTLDSPSRISPSTGIFSPGLTLTTEPSATSSIDTSFSIPSITILAVLADRLINFFIASLV